jgi:hypothetical protein
MELSERRQINETWEEVYDCTREHNKINAPIEVTNYLHSEYKLEDGRSMFDSIIWYINAQVNKIESLLAEFNIEIARNMTEKCIKETFTDTKKVPNSLIKVIPYAHYDTNKIKEKKTNRNKTALLVS